MSRKSVPFKIPDVDFKNTKHIKLLFIVQSLLHHCPSIMWIKIIQITIQIECLY